MSDMLGDLLSGTTPYMVLSSAAALAAGWYMRPRRYGGSSDTKLDFANMDGGELVASVLAANGVRFLFTLPGGHISPIVVGCKRAGVRVIDVRHEVNAVFAADAVARCSGVPGVAAVTAGPGLTNTITAVKNAQLAQSPLVLLGGAAPLILKGRGALQDIDQKALFAPHVKWIGSVRRVRDIIPIMEEALRRAQESVPGPVFVEFPTDALYSESVCRSFFASKIDKAKTLSQKIVAGYLRYHLHSLFAGTDNMYAPEPLPPVERLAPPAHAVQRARRMLEKAQRPVLLIGSQTTQNIARLDDLRKAVQALGVPVYLSGMGRGLLGKRHTLHIRHKRRVAFKSADLVILCGVPQDFRLEYGDQVRRSTPLISVNVSKYDLFLNRTPTHAVHADPSLFLIALAREWSATKITWGQWHAELQARDATREDEIASQRAESVEVERDGTTHPAANPLQVLQHLHSKLPDDAVLCVDGGDFVGSCAYIVAPRKPLGWLDPGQFGTLGVGAGFALGAKLCNPDAEVWIVWGDGSAGYSIAEYDTFVRHGIPVLSIIGNDACWTQIARDQIHILGDSAGCDLTFTDYHVVAEGYGGKGYLACSNEDAARAIELAQADARAGRPACINVVIGKTDFRKGSISM